MSLKSKPNLREEDAEKVDRLVKSVKTLVEWETGEPYPKDMDDVMEKFEYRVAKLMKQKELKEALKKTEKKKNKKKSRWR